jgi:hypothetical protein
MQRSLSSEEDRCGVECGPFRMWTFAAGMCSPVPPQVPISHPTTVGSEGARANTRNPPPPPSSLSSRHISKTNQPFSTLRDAGSSGDDLRHFGSDMPAMSASHPAGNDKVGRRKGQPVSPKEAILHPSRIDGRWSMPSMTLQTHALSLFWGKRAGIEEVNKVNTVKQVRSCEREHDRSRGSSNDTCRMWSIG